MVADIISFPRIHDAGSLIFRPVGQQIEARYVRGAVDVFVASVDAATISNSPHREAFARLCRAMANDVAEELRFP